MMIICRLAAILAERGVSRRELAKRAGLNRNTVCALAAHHTQRRIDVATLDKLCAVLQVQPGELLVWVEEA